MNKQKPSIFAGIQKSLHYAKTPEGPLKRAVDVLTGGPYARAIGRLEETATRWQERAESFRREAEAANNSADAAIATSNKYLQNRPRVG